MKQLQKRCKNFKNIIISIVDTCWRRVLFCSIFGRIVFTLLDTYYAAFKLTFCIYYPGDRKKRLFVFKVITVVMYYLNYLIQSFIFSFYQTPLVSCNVPVATEFSKQADSIWPLCYSCSKGTIKRSIWNRQLPSNITISINPHQMLVWLTVPLRAGVPLLAGLV